MEATLRRLVADEVGALVASARTSGRPVPDDDDQRLMARAVLRGALDERHKAALRLGEGWMADADEAALVERVLSVSFSSLSGLARYYQGRAEVTGVAINGHADVRVQLMGGTVQRAEPAAVSDAALVEMLQTVARRGGVVEKEFSPASPMLDLELKDGSRLNAVAWVSDRPYVTIRRHPLVDEDLDDLVQRGMVDRGMASLLTAAPRAGLNLLIAGRAGVGKTTLMRAIAHAAYGPDERLVVLEQEPELYLGANPARHNQVAVLCERTANMEGQGGISLADLAKNVKRMDPGRIIVGEVRGEEIIDMLEALSQGLEGSMSTIHAQDSWSIFPRLPIYARRSGRDWRTADVLQLAAVALDLVVFIDRSPTGERVVSEVRYVESYDSLADQIVTGAWFMAGPGRAAVPNPEAPIPVRLLDDLVAHGYDPTGHLAATNANGWRR